MSNVKQTILKQSTIRESLNVKQFTSIVTQDSPELTSQLNVNNENSIIHFMKTVSWTYIIDPSLQLVETSASSSVELSQIDYIICLSSTVSDTSIN